MNSEDNHKGSLDILEDYIKRHDEEIEKMKQEIAVLRKDVRESSSQVTADLHESFPQITEDLRKSFFQVTEDLCNKHETKPQ